ncbi:GNAT family acetyltransferase [Saccharomonospora azurea]|uniref:GNAT family acetyltransferase n=1 Tax=Saccharomonospora azurea TaxID=40988 RepID=UPI003323FFB0
MKIEPLPPRLYRDAITLWRVTGLTRPWNDPETDLRTAMAGPASTVLAGIDDRTLVATAMVGHDGHRGWVYYLAVEPSRQAGGLGRQMMRACEQWVRARGISKMQLMVRTENQAVIDFYATLGYTDAKVVVLGRRLDERTT